jgi:TRAP-type C4-dicarboxylate transport system permease small subunit
MVESGEIAEARQAGLPTTNGCGSVFLAGLASGAGCLGIAALIVVIILTCADIAWRRIVGGAFMDIQDATKLCLVAAASWSIPYGFVRGTHVTVDLLAERLPRGVQLGLEATSSLASAALLGFLLWLSWQATALRFDYGDASPNLGIPMVCYWAILLLGLAMSVAAAIQRAVCAVAAWRRARSGVGN